MYYGICTCIDLLYCTTYRQAYRCFILFLFFLADERKQVSQFFLKSESSAQPVVSHLRYDTSSYIFTSPLLPPSLPPLSPLSPCTLLQWRRASDKVFVPSFMKNLLVTGVFGEKVRTATAMIIHTSLLCVGHLFNVCSSSSSDHTHDVSLPSQLHTQHR